MRTLIEPLQAFGPCLKDLLAKKRISASELSRMMGYKSRNTIFRILDEQSGEGSRQALYDRLTRENPLGLEERERAALAQALEISRVGEKDFLSNYAMGRLLMRREKDAEEEIRVAKVFPDEEQRRIFSRMADAKRMNITITGCCHRAIFNMLREHLHESGAEEKTQIRHFVYTGPEEIVQNIEAIQPLLYCDFYQGYGVEPGMFSREREGIYRGNRIFVHFQDGQGKWFDQVFLLVDRCVFAPMRCMESEAQPPYEPFFAHDMHRLQPLKADFARRPCLKSYMEYTEGCRRLEEGRAIYTIKPDIQVSFISPDILKPCLYDGMQAMEPDGDEPREAREAAAQKLIDIHRRRYENFFAKKTPTHTIYSRAAMERFARTGRQSDHFFAFRAYTREERVSILTHLRRQLTENPHFHIHFFRMDMESSRAEVGLYEGAGTLIAKPQTHYDLAGDHAETIITQGGFCERYKAFYADALLNQGVLGERETIRVMDELIEIAQNA